MTMRIETTIAGEAVDFQAKDIRDLERAAGEDRYAIGAAMKPHVKAADAAIAADDFDEARRELTRALEKLWDFECGEAVARVLLGGMVGEEEAARLIRAQGLGIAT